jgi:hypothetical protein
MNIKEGDLVSIKQDFIDKKIDMNMIVGIYGMSRKYMV